MQKKPMVLQARHFCSKEQSSQRNKLKVVAMISEESLAVQVN